MSSSNNIRESTEAKRERRLQRRCETERACRKAEVGFSINEGARDNIEQMKLPSKGRQGLVASNSGRFPGQQHQERLQQDALHRFGHLNNGLD